MPARTLVAGVDSSTQSTKVVVCAADTGEVLRQGRADHPEGTEVHPQRWWEALEQATAGGLLEEVAAVAVAGQQHGMVVLDDRRAVVRPALLWNDIRSAAAARDLHDELGGPGAWAAAVGSVPLASFTVTKLRWLAEHEPAAAARVAHVVLPHDYLTGRLLGGGPLAAELVTDRGDASGTGYWSPATGEYVPELLERALGHPAATPRVLGPTEPAGMGPRDVLVAAGTGDNMGAALGLGADLGDVVVSLGTSGVVSAVHDAASADPTGIIAGFADATGRFLPLACTLNAARVLTATARMLGTDLPGLDRLALEAEPGAGGLVLLPYLDGERTPDLPDATGTLTGLTRAAMTPQNLARAAVEGMLCGLADGLDALRAVGIVVRRVLLVGGAARSAAVQRVAPGIFAAPVTVPEPGEYVARGAARQAAWALATAGGASGGAPDWRLGTAMVRDPEDVAAGSDVRERYAGARQRLHPA